MTGESYVMDKCLIFLSGLNIKGLSFEIIKKSFYICGINKVFLLPK